MNFAAILLTLSVTVLATNLHAQSRPDFAGRWALDRDATVSIGGGRGDGSGGGGGAGGGAGLGAPPLELDILQSDTILTVEERIGTNAVIVIYRLDGKRTRNFLPIGRGSTAEAHYTSRWSGSSLVTAVTRSISRGGSVINLEYREVRSLSADGSMVVETTMRGRALGRKAVYRKSA